MRFAIIENGKVTNVIEAPMGFSMPGATLVPSDTANIGQSYTNGAFVPPPIVVDQNSVVPQEMMLKSPDGTAFNLTIADDGKVSSEPKGG